MIKKEQNKHDKTALDKAKLLERIKNKNKTNTSESKNETNTNDIKVE